MRRRLGHGWTDQGQARFDAPDNAAAFKRLKQQTAPSDGGNHPPVLLILPEDQILYRHIEADAAAEDPAAAVREALDGATTYALEALRFTFAQSDTGEIAFAAVALETLDEAEDFARAQGFDPKGILGPAMEDGTTAWFGLSTDGAPEGWMPRPDDISWPVAPEEAERPEPNPVKIAAANSIARSKARHTPVVTETVLEEELAEEDLPELEPIHYEPGFLDQIRNHGVRLLAFCTVAIVGYNLSLVFLGAPQPSAEEPVEIAALPEPEQPTPPLPAPAPRPVNLTAAPVTEFVPAPRAESPIPPEAVDAIIEGDFWTPERGLMNGASTADLENLVQPSLDPPMGTESTALNMADLQTAPPALALSNPLPGPNDRYDIDDAGLIRAEPDGVLSPEGYLIIAGTPPQNPGPRSKEIEAAAEAARSAPQATTPQAQPSGDAPIVPKPRPKNIDARVAPSPEVGRARPELAHLRPLPRPSSTTVAVKAANQAIETAAIDAALSAAQNSAASAPAPTPTRSVSASQPAPSKTIAAPKAAKPSTSTTSAASPPSKTQQREIAASYTEPKQKTSKSVEKKATNSNRMDLKKVNLLGTFGSAGSQRALVRLPSGKVVNVKVGDRMDGGKVAAIGKGELRYVKQGRAHTLTMPRG
ncbi:MAG: pilus assembly protein PilP [Mangrovicoccus sp.]|nr:pilus assembly protein PilP [Mangrovicoccus sp.]